jgi:hypothetical protein
MLSNWKYPHIVFIINKEYPIVFLQVFHIISQKNRIFSFKFSKLLTKSISLFSNVFHVI